MTCDLGDIGPFGGDFDDWPIADKPGVTVLSGCLPKSKDLARPTFTVYQMKKIYFS